MVVEPGRGGDQGQERAPHGIDPAGELVEGVGAVADQPVPGDGGDERLGVLVVLASLVRRDA